jgi:hypothetical protein
VCGDGLVDSFQETQELLMAVPAVAITDDFPGSHIESSE